MTNAETLETLKIISVSLWSIARRNERLERMLRTIDVKVDTVMGYKEDLMELVEGQETLKQSFVAYDDGIKSRIDQLKAELLAALSGNPALAEVDALVAKAKADINSDSNEVFDRMRANTPEG